MMLYLEIGSCILYGVNIHMLSWIWRQISVRKALIVLSLGLLALAMCWWGLWSGIMTHDYSIKYAYEHSASNLHWPMTLGLLWAGHPGANLFFLTVCYVSAWVVCLLLNQKDNMPPFIKCYMTYHLVGFFILMLWLSSPFERTWPFPPNTGIELNPLLQDHALSYHPPLLLGSSALFFSIALLDSLPLYADSLRAYRYGLLLHHLGLLLIGMIAGAYWAYHVLGWGGWWFWDPVETISFITWMGGIVLLHQHTQSHRSTIFTGRLVWSIVLLGLWAVRSNQIISVHSFVTQWGDLPWLFFAIGSLSFALPKMSSLKIPDTKAWGTYILWGVVFLGLFAPMVSALWRESFHLSPRYYEGNLLNALLFFLAQGSHKKYGRALSGLWLVLLIGDASPHTIILYISGLLIILLWTKKWSTSLLAHMLVLSFIGLSILQRQGSDQREISIGGTIMYQNISLEKNGGISYREQDGHHIQTQRLLINNQHPIEIENIYIPAYQQENTPITYWSSPWGDDYGFCWLNKTDVIRIFYRPFMMPLWIVSLSLGVLLWLLGSWHLYALSPFYQRVRRRLRMMFVT